MAAPVPAVRELTADEQVRHVLGRLAFGARPGDVARVRAMGVDAWVARQLAPETIPDTAMERMLSEFETLELPLSEVGARYQKLRVQRRARQREGLTAAPGGRPAMAGAAGMEMGQPRESTRVAPVGKGARPEMETAGKRARRARAYAETLREAQEPFVELQTARIARAVGSERQLQEVLVDFWANHFSVYAGKGPVRYMIPAYERDVIRPHVMGRFRDMLGAVAKSPAMLFYLDNWQSAADSGRPTLARGRGGIAARAAARRGVAKRDSATARRPVVAGLPARRPRGLNENYARELLELHTLGVDGGYTQRDVIEVARALTGWSLQEPRAGGGFVFRREVHDAGEKTVLGHRLPAGRGIEDGEQVLDLVARHPATSRFIARKLAMRFVSDAPPEALVERAATTFRETDGDLRATVRTIVTSPEFYARSAYRSKIKSPFELVASAARAVGAAPDTSPRLAQLMARLGQPAYGHQAPNGWPEIGSAWMNTGAIVNRINFGLAVATGRLPGASLARWPDAAAMRRAPRDQQVDFVVESLLGGGVSPDTREVLRSGTHPLLGTKNGAAMAGADSMVAGEQGAMMGAQAGASRQRQGKVGPGTPRGPNPLMRPVALQGFAQVVGLALGAPEFQRR